MQLILAGNWGLVDVSRDVQVFVARDNWTIDLSLTPQIVRLHTWVKDSTGQTDGLALVTGQLDVGDPKPNRRDRSLAPWGGIYKQQRVRIILPSWAKDRL